MLGYKKVKDQNFIFLLTEVSLTQWKYIRVECNLLGFVLHKKQQHINTCVLDSHDYTGAYVGDDNANDACKPVLSADGLTYELEHGLDECGMALEFVEDTDGDYLKYSVSDLTGYLRENITYF